MKGMDRPLHRAVPRLGGGRLFLCAALAAALPGPGCATGQRPRAFKESHAKTLSRAEAPRSFELIDNYETFVIHFRLAKDAPALSVGISAEYVADITGAKKTRKTYFIVEKIIDMSQFKNANLKYLYAELGRNFDAEWNREREITLVSNKIEPFKNLDAGSTYRTRYTTFSNANFEYIITINPDCGVTFIDHYK